MLEAEQAQTIRMTALGHEATWITPNQMTGHVQEDDI
jgi:hypothetical protein